MPQSCCWWPSFPTTTLPARCGKVCMTSSAACSAAARRMTVFGKTAAGKCLMGPAPDWASRLEEGLDRMKLNTLFAITSVVSLAFGVGFLLAPGPLLAIYGLSIDPVGVLLARFAGSAFICLTPLTWL